MPSLSGTNMFQPKDEKSRRNSWTTKKILSLPGLSQEMRDSYTEMKAQQDRAKEVVREFVQGAVAGSPERMLACFDEIEMGIGEPGGGWVGVMRAVSRQPSVPRVTREFFLRVFIKWGDHLRQECSDLVLADGLRMLLPKYKGPAIHLYRGEGFPNRRQRTYGLSWSASADVARCHAEKTLCRSSLGGSVLLETIAPADAVISRVPATKDHYREEEYVVDRRRLTSVKVIERFAHLPRLNGELA